MKYQKGISKYILLEAFEDVLPRHVMAQPKRGFEIPMNHWLQTDLKDIVDDTLSSSSIRSRGIYRQDVVFSLLNDWRAGRVPYMDIWSLVMLELWFRKFSPSTAYRI